MDTTKNTVLVEKEEKKQTYRDNEWATSRTSGVNCWNVIDLSWLQNVLEAEI